MTQSGQTEKLENMKTTIELPDQVFQQAREQAEQRGVDVNEFISAAVSKLIQSGTPTASLAVERRVEFPIIQGKPDAPTLTQEAVNRAEEQILKEEAEYYAKFMRR